MGSPETTVAVAEAVRTSEGAFEELSGCLLGWKRKQAVKKGGTPRKKDVIFVAPDGEEIKTKRQLEKYLKAHSGTLSVSDFEWGVTATDAVTPTESRRRSARLSSKCCSSADGLEEISLKPPVVKRSRKSREHGKDGIDVASKDRADIPADCFQGKEEEYGFDKGESNDINLDVSKVEVPSVEESKEVTAVTLIDVAEDKKVVPGGISGEKPAETSTVIEDTKESKVEEIPVGINELGKPNEEAELSPPQCLTALVGEIPKRQEVEGLANLETFL